MSFEWESYPWASEALCIGRTELFYDQATTEALAICALCPVINECRETAIKNREEFGVWGGLTAPQRKAEIARRRSRKS